MVEPMEVWEAVLILHIIHQVVCPIIGILPVFLQVCDDDLAGGVVPVQGEECLFALMVVSKDKGAKRVVFQNEGWFIHMSI